MNGSKRTLCLKPLFRSNGWRRVFTPGYQEHRSIDLRSLQGSASLAALEAALPDKNYVGIDFRDTTVVLTPDFEIILENGQECHTVPKHTSYPLPYGKQYTLDLGNGLRYELSTT